MNLDKNSLNQAFMTELLLTSDSSSLRELNLELMRWFPPGLNSDLQVVPPIASKSRSPEGLIVSATEIVVVLGSAGAFTALYQVLGKFLDRHKDREVVIERNGVKISLKAHSPGDAKAILAQILPELSSDLKTPGHIK